MPVDSSIYGMLRQPQAGPGPLELAGQAYQIKHMIDAGQLNDLQRQQLQESVFENQRIRDLFSNGGTPTESQVFAVSPKMGLTYQKTLLENAKTKAETEKANAQALGEKTKQLRDQLATVNDDGALGAWAKNAMDVYGMQAVQGMPQSVSDPRFSDWRNNRLMTADQIVEKLKPQYHVYDTGSGFQVGNINPNAPGGVTPPPAKTLSPADKLHAQVQAATADPFGILGIKDIADRAVAGAPSAKPSSVQTTAPVIAPPPEAGKGAAPIPSNWKSLMGSDVHGDDFLKAIPPAIAPQIKAYAEGRMAFPAGFALKSPYFQAIMQMVGQYDPTFDAVNYNGRNKTYTSFTAGPDAEKVKNINQTLHHAGQLNDAIENLDNFNGLATPLNSVVNPVEKFFGDARPGVFEQKAQAVASELRKVYAGTSGGGLTELKKWEESLPVNASKEQQKAYLQSGMELLNGALSALQEKYRAGMGPRADVGTLLKPEARSILQRLAPGTLESGSETPAKPAAVQPTRDQIDAELRRRGVIK